MDNMERSQEGEAPVSLAHMSYPSLANGTEVIMIGANSRRDASWILVADGPTNGAYTVKSDEPPCFSGMGPEYIDGSRLTLPLRTRWVKQRLSVSPALLRGRGEEACDPGFVMDIG